MWYEIMKYLYCYHNWKLSVNDIVDPEGEIRNINYRIWWDHVKSWSTGGVMSKFEIFVGSCQKMKYVNYFGTHK